MELSPIPGIRAVSAVRPRTEGLQAPSIFDVDRSEKPAERNVQRADRKASGAEEDAEEELMAKADEPDEEEAGKSVDYFA